MDSGRAKPIRTQEKPSRCGLMESKAQPDTRETKLVWTQGEQSPYGHKRTQAGIWTQGEQSLHGHKRNQAGIGLRESRPLRAPGKATSKQVHVHLIFG